MDGAKNNTLMGLRGQYGDRGYAMAALLVALAVMSVLMAALLPNWPFQAKREKEAELVFRGEQYARAIGLYQLKNRAFPPSIEVLVQGRYLRKKYKDPMTKDGEFQPLYAGTNPGPGGTQGAAGSTTQRPNSPPQTPGPGPGLGGSTPGQAGPGGIIGVVSKSKEESIRLYKGRNHYNEWQFVFANVNRGGPGGNPGGQAQPGMPGGRGRGFPGVNNPGFPPGGRGSGGGPGPDGTRVPGPGRGGPGGAVRPPGQ
jgi:type II secretory pathway pseudopilin PulG